MNKYVCPECGSNTFDVFTNGVTEYKQMTIRDGGEIRYSGILDTIYEESYTDQYLCADCGAEFEFEDEEDFLEYLAEENASKEQEKQMKEEEDNENLKNYISELQKEIDFLAQEIVTLKRKVLS